MAYGNVSLPAPAAPSILLSKASLFEVSFGSWPFDFMNSKAYASNRSRPFGLTDHTGWQTGIRCASLEAGEHKSGHIAIGPNEGLLFFDSQ